MAYVPTSQLAESIDWKRVKLPDEFKPINSIILQIQRVRMEADKRAMQQHTEIFSAFDELDYELYRSGWKERYSDGA